MNPIYLPEESSQRLRGLAELTGETITRIGQVAIERYLDQVSATVRPQS
jgi:predicted DNA-binding protein